MLKYVSTLVLKEPVFLFGILESAKFKRINLPDLMPAMMLCPEEARTHAILYIKNFCVTEMSSRSLAVHNMLVHMYARAPSTIEILKFLQEVHETLEKFPGREVYFDVNYALDICQKRENETNAELNKVSKLQEEIHQSIG